MTRFMFGNYYVNCEEVWSFKFMPRKLEPSVPIQSRFYPYGESYLPSSTLLLAANCLCASQRLAFPHRLARHYYTLRVKVSMNMKKAVTLALSWYCNAEQGRLTMCSME